MAKSLPICFFLLVIATISGFGQQDPLYSLYLNNPIAINPAYTGINNTLNITAGFRKQWAGFDGSPTTTSLTANTSLQNTKMGAGMVIVNDQIGNVTNTQVTGTYAYKIKLSNEQLLSFGMQAGFMNYKSNDSKLNIFQSGDPLFQNVSQIKPMIGAGVMLKSDRYLIGLSVPRLLNSTFNVQGNSFTVYQQHFYLLGSYIFPMSARVYFKPSVLLKAVKGAPLSADVNLNINIDQKYTIGLYTRNLNSYGLLTQIVFLEYYKLAYALEIPTNKSVGAQFTTNELNLGINLAVFRNHSRAFGNF